MIITLLALLSQAAPVQDPAKVTRPWHDFEFGISGVVADIGSELEVISGTGVGAVVDGEEALGLDNSIRQMRIWASIALGERHRLKLDFMDLSRDSTKTLERDITIGDTTYTVGTTVSTDLDLQFINLTYAYSILYDDRMDVALTFGIHGLRTKFDIEGENASGETERFILPVPLPGISATFALTPDLFLKQNLELLWLRYENFQGMMVDMSLSLEYEIFEHVGIGIGYNTVRIRLDMEEETLPSVDFKGSFEFQFSGVAVYLTFFY